MRKDDAQLFIMKARVVAGWIEQEALDELEQEMAAEEEVEVEEIELTEEEKALLALGELGSDLDVQEEGGDETAPDTE